MMRKIYMTLLLLFIFKVIQAQEFNYMSQEKPGLTPQVFASDIISLPDQHEFGSVFSKRGDEFFYAVDRGSRAEILYSKYDNGRWSQPKVIIAHPQFGFNDPMLSVDEDKLYFISNKPLNEQAEGKDIDIWYADRTASGWSDPMPVSDVINSEKNEYYISFAADGSMYFASNVKAEQDKNYNFDIYKSAFVNGQFQQPEKLPETINTHRYEADVFVAPDESYMIFCAIRRGGLGRGDLYISFKNENDEWTEAKNMGEPINNEQHQLCPFVTHDGKFLFYTSNEDIYWVSTEILEKFRD